MKLFVFENWLLKEGYFVPEGHVLKLTLAVLANAHTLSIQETYASISLYFNLCANLYEIRIVFQIHEYREAS